MAAKKKPRVPKDDIWEILDDLSNGISMLSLVKESLGHQAIAGDEYATLKVAIKQLLDCHQRLDRTAPSREEDGQRKED